MPWAWARCRKRSWRGSADCAWPQCPASPTSRRELRPPSYRTRKCWRQPTA